MSRYGNAEDRTIYADVVNGVGQYSLWPAHESLPNGWTGLGKTGLRQECLDYIGMLMAKGQSGPADRPAAGGGPR
ncbi:MAG TPA: MbtH family NRPS accessory protein [Firmicutes bacterium]|nr:MbtH family NRPS accessory protein [Candidatus Fermentithermobacillaceae bacterium]